MFNTQAQASALTRTCFSFLNISDSALNTVQSSSEIKFSSDLEHHCAWLAIFNGSSANLLKTLYLKRGPRAPGFMQVVPKTSAS